MTEVMQDSAAAQAEQPHEAPVDSDPGEQLGAGAYEPDKFLGDSDEGDEQPAEPAAADDETAGDGQAATDNAEPDEETRDGILRQADYTRKTQELTKQRQELEERERALAAKEQPAAAPAPPPTAAAQADGLDVAALNGAIGQALQDPALPPTERTGLQVVGQLTSHLSQALEKIGALEQALGDISPKVEAASEASKAVSEQQNEALVKRISGEFVQAKELYGEAAVGASQEFIRANVRGINPVTGERWTIPQLVGMASGKTAEEVDGARAGSKQGRTAAKRGAAPAGLHADTGATGHLTQAEAISAIGATM